MELIVYAPVWGQSGFEKLSRGLILALDQMGVNIELRPANEWNQELVGLPDATVRRLMRMTETRVSSLAPHVIYQLPRGQHVLENAPTICFTLFETDRCPPAWIHGLNKMDKVMVFSEFNRKAWSETGIDPHRICALPQAVDSFTYHPDGLKMTIPEKRGFTFLCSGDFTERKNFEAVIEAYVKEFAGDDQVTLIFKCHYGGFVKKHRRNCRNKLREIAYRFNPETTPRILFWGEKVSDFAMAALYRSVDCFVLASRGEGLGMQYLEATASGIPVIAPDWGAQRDYLTFENSYLVKTTVNTIDDPNYIQKCIAALNSKWCQVSIDDLRQAMRYVKENYSEAHDRAQENLKWVREMTWQRMAIDFIKKVINMYDEKPKKAAA